MPRNQAVKDRLAELIADHSLFTCPPQALEFGFSARTAVDHEAARRYLAAFTPAPLHPDISECLDLQRRLWEAGHVRAAGATDTHIAAFALANRLTVLHYDRDFEHLAAAEPALRQEWVAPAGSID